MSENIFANMNIPRMQDIDTEDNEEFHVYANDILEGTEDMKRNKLSQQTGTETLLLSRNQHTQTFKNAGTLIYMSVLFRKRVNKD